MSRGGILLIRLGKVCRQYRRDPVGRSECILSITEQGLFRHARSRVTQSANNANHRGNGQGVTGSKETGAERGIRCIMHYNLILSISADDLLMRLISCWVIRYASADSGDNDKGGGTFARCLAPGEGEKDCRRGLGG